MIGKILVPYTFRHRYAKDSHTADNPLINISDDIGNTKEVLHQSFERLIPKAMASLYAKSNERGRENMKKILNSLKYFAPLIQIALCPVTILFLWTVFTGPEAIPEIKEELVELNLVNESSRKDNLSAY